ncbi:hypothetical protein BXY64_1949 [Marinifilum flexuosum]|uniref:Uncharacterized protein n=1 Tax=Marinifilum flexuosum TaxID=1117708 RepID=A0A419XAY5_9BACT|nr:hypothetical protein BXY64_1949 [Marinifilum flexuosum]
MRITNRNETLRVAIAIGSVIFLLCDCGIRTMRQCIIVLSIEFYNFSTFPLFKLFKTFRIKRAVSIMKQLFLLV